MFKDDFNVEEGVHYFLSSTPPSRNNYYDFEKKEMRSSTPSLIYGIVNYDPLSQLYYFGFYSRNLTKNVLVDIKGSIFGVFDKKYLKEVGFLEKEPDIYINPRSLVYKKDGKFTLGINSKSQIRNRKYSWNYDFPNNYGAKFLLEDFKRYHASCYIPNREGVFKLPELTFGVEFETCSGAVPQTECTRLGLIPLRDGSISGNEYATIPLKGKSGIGVLHETCEVLQSYCDIDHQCSLHVHVGVPSVDKKLVVAAYHYFKVLEPQILNMFPFNIVASSTFKKGDKDYCKRLPEDICDSGSTVDKQFKQLFDMYAETPGYNFEGFGANHPHDRDGNRKWEVHARYKWVNLVNLIFGGAKTIEFRVHTPTLNKYKVIPWIYICTSLVWYLLNHQDEIIESAKKGKTKLVLDSIISSCFKDRTIVDYLLSYIFSRIKMVAQHQNCYGDRFGFLEILDDVSYSFNYKQIELVK